MFKIIRKLVIKKPTQKKILERVGIEQPFVKKPRSRTKNKELTDE